MISDFQKLVLNFFEENKRDFPWRHTYDPYKILVSELMLQQTQVDRVVPKFQAFIIKFPTPAILAAAPTDQVLGLWQGLGYNRRALYLQRTAQEVIQKYAGNFPNSYLEIQKLPGIGPYTASAICAFAYNMPVVMIETNIRRVFLHHFFKDREGVGDGEILPLIEQEVYLENPRLWYSALMDYGTYLGKSILNPNRRSRHYTKQSKFEGSKRQLRGELLRLYLENGLKTVEEAKLCIGNDFERIELCWKDLENEGFIQIT